MYDDTTMRVMQEIRARKVVEEKFSWDKITQEYIKMYKELLSMHGAKTKTRKVKTSSKGKK